MSRVQIKANLAKLLDYIGNLYKSPADALKEYISNALDKWKEARSRGELMGPCKVNFDLQKSEIILNYNAPGMNKKEFELALQRVADSIKTGLQLPQIGQLGIGIFAFKRVGTTATFYSKKSIREPTIKVILEKGSDKAEISEATKHESRANPGMTIHIRGLSHDPIRSRGPLAAEVLRSYFAEKFDSYLCTGDLEVTIVCRGVEYRVEPIVIGLPQIGIQFQQVHLRKNGYKTFSCHFWFDDTGGSRVSLRNLGVVIIDDFKNVQAYGLEEGILSSGFVRGNIDVDFLKPLPARISFEENQDWIQFLNELDIVCRALEIEVDQLRKEKEAKELTELQKKAVELARQILEQKQFQDLDLLGGLSKRQKKEKKKSRKKKGPPGELTGEKSKETGERRTYTGMRIMLEERPFLKNEAHLHSRFLNGKVLVNKINPDYKKEMYGSNLDKLSYITTMIGKETLTYNDQRGIVNDHLEKILTFIYQVKARVIKLRRTSKKSLEL